MEWELTAGEELGFLHFMEIGKLKEEQLSVE